MRAACCRPRSSLVDGWRWRPFAEAGKLEAAFGSSRTDWSTRWVHAVLVWRCGDGSWVATPADTQRGLAVHERERSGFEHGFAPGILLRAGLRVVSKEELHRTVSTTHRDHFCAIAGGMFGPFNRTHDLRRSLPPDGGGSRRWQHRYVNGSGGHPSDGSFPRSREPVTRPGPLGVRVTLGSTAPAPAGAKGPYSRGLTWVSR
jgi:hypothetical protein